MARAVIRHALRMIFGNLPQALRSSVVPLGGAFLAGLAIEAALGWPDPQLPAEAGRAVFAMLATLAVNLAAGAWLAVTWNRFVLLEEEPAWLPRWPAEQIWPYIAAAAMVFGATALFAIPVVLLSALAGTVLLAVTMGALPQGLVLGATSLLAMVAITILSLRLSLGLPAAAVGRQITPLASWAQFRGRAAMLPGIALAFLAPFIGTFGAAMLTATSGAAIIGTVLGIGLSWFAVMFGAALLTTLYGHVVEGRALS